MKKIFYILQIVVFSMLFSAAAMADDDDWGDGRHGGWGRHGHHGWGHHHGHHGWGHHHGHGWGHGRRGWNRPQVNNYYYTQPQPNYYYQQPPVAYASPPPPVYGGYDGYYDNRSHQGLAGGVLGTVFGYELGNGHPLAAGVGAAAGSFLGNGMGWRY